MDVLEITKVLRSFIILMKYCAYMSNYVFTSSNHDFFYPYPHLTIYSYGNGTF